MFFTRNTSVNKSMSPPRRVSAQEQSNQNALEIEARRQVAEPSDFWHDNCDCERKCLYKNRVCLFSIFSVLIGILIITLVSISYAYVEWDEWAFQKDISTNKVDTAHVYENGRYYWGPGKTKISFSNLYHLQETNFSIAASNGQEFGILVKFFWRPKKSELATIYRKFGTTISQQVSNRANSAIKNVAPLFSINEYIQNRTTIPDTLYSSLFTELSGVGVDVPREGFHLHEIFIPQKVSEINLNNAVQTQTNVLRHNEQLAVSVRSETERLDQEIRSNTTFLILQTDAQIARLASDAKTETSKLLAEADGNGIKGMFDALNVTSDETKRLFFQFFTLINVLNPTF